MLYFDRIDISEEIDLAKSNSSKKCIFLTIFFFNHRFEFEDFICNGCHDLSTLSVNISDIAKITVKNIDYRYIIIPLANLKQLFYQKILCLRTLGINKNIFLIFSLFKTIFFLLFLVIIYKSVDIMDV